MNRKALLWAICALLYVMQIPFAVVLIIVAVNPDFSDAVFRGVAIASASACVLVVVLCILNIATVTYFYGHYKFVCIVHHTSSFIGDCKYGFFSLDYSVKMC